MIAETQIKESREEIEKAFDIYAKELARLRKVQESYKIVFQKHIYVKELEAEIKRLRGWK